MKFIKQKIFNSILLLSILSVFILHLNINAFSADRIEEDPLLSNKIKDYKEKYKMGTLTQEEIEKGKKILNRKQYNEEQIEANDKDKIDDKIDKDKIDDKIDKDKIDKDKIDKDKIDKDKIDDKIDKDKIDKDKIDKDKIDKDKPKTSPEQTKLEIFGHQLFSKTPDTFAPIESVPISNDYMIGPKDQIKVVMYGKIDESAILNVDNEGTIILSKIGPLSVAGTTFGELKELIKAKVEAITGVKVNVSMAKLRAIQIFVLGEVKKPGVYTVSSLATLANALLSAGGPNDLGSLRKVQLKRQGKVITTIDFYDFMLKGDNSSDISIKAGDVIFVPQRGPMVTIIGDVNRPAIYEIKNERKIKDAISLAGGLSPQAFNQRIQIERSLKNQSQIILDASYEELKNTKNSLSVQDGDLIRIFSILSKKINAVYLYGNVLRPGSYAFKQGMRVTNIILNVKSLDIDTYFDYALIKRYSTEKMKYKLIPFNIGKLLNNKDNSQNILLAPEDQIYIFNKDMVQDKKYVGIEGEIRQPGRYIIEASNFNLKDLILKAGNITNNAYTEIGHLYRRDNNKANIKLLTFNIRKVLEGDPIHNFLMENNDKVIIHNYENYREKFEVSINGIVNKPGKYPYAENMTVMDLIGLSGNVKNTTYLKEAELVRFNISDNKIVNTSIFSINLQLAQKSDPAHNLKLHPLDVLTVREIPEWYDQNKAIDISGEVYFPGKYPIIKGERLSEAVERAGGYTDKAYLKGAAFIRESIKKNQQEQIDRMISQLEEDISRYSSQKIQTSLSQADALKQEQFINSQKALVEKIKSIKAQGRIIINLLPIELLKNESSNVILEHGDSLYIPKEPATINVIGAVYNPTSLIYDRFKPEMKLYIDKTGGMTENANDKGVYIIRADGTVVSRALISSGLFGISWNQDEKRWGFWNKFENTPLYPGDTIVIPEKIEKPAYMKDFKDITEILYQLAVTAGVTISQVFK